MINYTIKELLDTLKDKNFKVYTKPYQLNIVGIRTTEQPNKFDDTMCVFWKDDNIEENNRINNINMNDNKKEQEDINSSDIKVKVLIIIFLL